MYTEWHLFITAVIFTFVGIKFVDRKKLYETIVNSAIDTLIKEGYIKTRGKGDKMILLKHWEE